MFCPFGADPADRVCERGGPAWSSGPGVLAWRLRLERDGDRGGEASRLFSQSSVDTRRSRQANTGGILDRWFATRYGHVQREVGGAARCRCRCRQGLLPRRAAPVAFSKEV